MAMREYQCDQCGHVFEELVMTRDPEEYKYADCRCGEKAEVLPGRIGGVNGVKLSDARPAKSTCYNKPGR